MCHSRHNIYTQSNNEITTVSLQWFILYGVSFVLHHCWSTQLCAFFCTCSRYYKRVFLRSRPDRVFSRGVLGFLRGWEQFCFEVSSKQLKKIPQAPCFKTEYTPKKNPAPHAKKKPCQLARPETRQKKTQRDTSRKKRVFNWRVDFTRQKETGNTPKKYAVLFFGVACDLGLGACGLWLEDHGLCLYVLVCL